MADAASSESNINDEQSATPKERTPTGWHQFWQKEVSAADKRLRKFRKQGNEVNKRFLDERAGVDMSDSALGTTTSLNLFHTNITTMQAMLYGQTPKADVSREHNDPDDDVARVAAVLFQRMLEADFQPSGEDLATVLKASLQDRLLPGVGLARVRYEVTTEKVPSLNTETMEVEQVEQTVDEDAPVDYVHWQDATWGWGRTWREIPWWGFRSYLTKEQAAARFGQEKTEGLDYREQSPAGTDNRDDTTDKEQTGNIQKAEIHEIWAKEEQKVFWYSPGADTILDMRDDPLKLDGFWPMPRPMIANTTTSLYLPKADYVIAQDLYNEIDELQARIRMITRACKVVGVYDASAGDSVGRMLNEGVENDLIEVDNWAMFAEKGGLKGSIDWFPTDVIATVLQTLGTVQQQKTEQLYEITGMSDMMRGGNTDQYTSDGTNQLKAKMGSIRVQAIQDEFARFASDLEALKAEVIAKHFDQQTILKQSNAQFMPEADKDKVMPAIELMKQPDIKWRVNIRPESIAMVDYAQLRSERTEFLTAMATYMQSAQAVIKQIPDATPILLEMLKWGMAGFKGSDYLEGTMDQAIEMAKKAPPGGDQKDDGKAQESQMKMQIEQMKLQGIQMKGQQEIQKIQMKAQSDMQTLKMKVDGELQKINADAQADQTLEQMDARNELIKIQENLNANLQEIAANMEADLNIERAQATYDIASQEQQHTNTMTEIQSNAKESPE